MTKEELEKYINEKVEITIENHLGSGTQTFKGKLIKKDPALSKLMKEVYGSKHEDDWFILILESKKSINFHFKIVKKVKRLEYKL